MIIQNIFHPLFLLKKANLKQRYYLLLITRVASLRQNNDSKKNVKYKNFDKKNNHLLIQSIT